MIRSAWRRVRRWLSRVARWGRGYPIPDPANCDHAPSFIPAGRHSYLCPICWEVFVEVAGEFIPSDEACRRGFGNQAPLVRLSAASALPGGLVMTVWECPICGDQNCEGFCDDD